MEAFLKILVVAILFVVNIFIVKYMINDFKRGRIVEVKLTDEELEKMKKELEDLLNEEDEEYDENEN